jgi:hypothetical protein
MNYNIIAIEPNSEVKRAYEFTFGKNVKVYRDKKTFDNANHNFENKNPVVLIMEASFAKDLDHRLDDAYSRLNYPKRMFETLTSQDLDEKALSIGLGIEVAKDIRNGKYKSIDQDTPIIFATWMNNYNATESILKLQNTAHIPKESIILNNKMHADEIELCKKIEKTIDDSLTNYIF